MGIDALLVETKWCGFLTAISPADLHILCATSDPPTLLVETHPEK